MPSNAATSFTVYVAPSVNVARVKGAEPDSANGVGIETTPSRPMWNVVAAVDERAVLEDRIHDLVADDGRVVDLVDDVADRDRGRVRLGRHREAAVGGA